MKTIKEYFRITDSTVRNTNYSNCRPTNIYAPITYALNSGGKRLRPILMLAVIDALGKNPEHYLNAAVAIEMFHNFTLIHDDIMDHAETRHGKPAVHVKWGEATAILSGDLMQSIAVMMISDTIKNDAKASLDLVNSFNTTAVKVFRGQQYDLDFETRDKVSVDDYMLMIGLKTSALIGGACHLGAICADADNFTRNQFYEYGYSLGIAFQLQDDLLDTFGDETTFGKRIGGDIENDKKTWLNIMATNEAPERMAEAMKLSGAAKIAAVREIYESLDLRNRCEMLINEYITEAINALDGLPIDNEASAFFSDFAHSLVGRTK